MEGNISEKIRDQGLKILTRRECSVLEFTQKLLLKFPGQEEIIEMVKQEFLEKGWVSDDRFCEAFLRHQLLVTKWGPQKMILKLQEKGIDPALASEYVQKVFPEQEQLDLAKTLAVRKHAEILQKGKTKSEFEAKQKVRQFLMGKGYESDVVREVIESI